MLNSIVDEARRMPVRLWIGGGTFAAAALIDLSFHSAEALGWHTTAHAMEHLLGQDVYPVHVALFMGMVLILAGVLSGKRRSDDVRVSARPHQP